LKINIDEAAEVFSRRQRDSVLERAEVMYDFLAQDKLRQFHSYLWGEN